MIKLFFYSFALLLIIFSSKVLAENGRVGTPLEEEQISNAPEVIEAIEKLGLGVELFSFLWPSQCSHEMRMKMTKQEFEKVPETMHLAMSLGFFKVINSDEGVVVVPGVRCAALNDYYYKGTKSDEIESFIKSDQSLLESYGYHAIDLFLYGKLGRFISYNTFNASPSSLAQIKKHLEYLEKQNLFKVIERKKTNGYKREKGEIVEYEVPEYSVFHLEYTDQFTKFLESHQKP